MSSQWYSIFLGLLASLVSSLLHAEQSDETALMQLRANHPITGLFGLPVVASRPVQSHELLLSLEHSNQFMGGNSTRESLLLDGETSLLTLHHKQRFGSCVQLEAVVPFIQHSGGTFDSAIDDWHRVLGLPDAQRSEAPFDVLSYRYSDENGDVFNLDRAESGIGDIQLSLQRFLGCFATADSTALESIARVGIKIPTGSSSELRGSGAFDAYIDWQSPVFTNGGRLRGGFAIGALLAGQSDLFSNQNSIIGYGSFGAQFMFSSRVRLLMQMDWNTAFFNSQLRELGDPAIALTGGIRIIGPSDQSFEFSISEDVSIDTTPDIVARFSWAYRPSGGR